MQKIGPCKFSELPQQYQDSFESGKIHSAAGQFFPYKPSDAAIPMAVVLSIIYIIPGIAAIFVLPCFFLQDTARLSRLVDGLTAGVFPFLVTLAIFGVIIWGVYFMLSNGLKSLAGAATWINTKQQAAAGKNHYGLLLDEQNLVFRHGEQFEDHTCAFLPKRAITDTFVSHIWVEGPKRRVKLDVVKIRFVDEQGYSNELVMREYFAVSVPEMCDQIRQWLLVSEPYPRKSPLQP